MHYYLPNYQKTSFDFIRAILAKKKRCITNLYSINFIGIKNLRSKIHRCSKVHRAEYSKIRPLVQEIEDLNSYFANMKENEFLEREYLWKIVSTLRPDSINELIKTARKNRTTKEFAYENDFIQTDLSIYQEISAIAAQKCKFVSLGIKTIFNST